MKCISKDHQEGTVVISRAGRESQDVYGVIIMPTN